MEFDSMTMKELHQFCKDNGITGYSSQEIKDGKKEALVKFVKQQAKQLQKSSQGASSSNLGKATGSSGSSASKSKAAAVVAGTRDAAPVGVSSSSGKTLEEMTINELKEFCKENGITGYCSKEIANKQQLLELVQSQVKQRAKKPAATSTATRAATTSKTAATRVNNTSSSSTESSHHGASNKDHDVSMLITKAAGKTAARVGKEKDTGRSAAAMAAAAVEISGAVAGKILVDKLNRPYAEQVDVADIAQVRRCIIIAVSATIQRIRLHNLFIA